MSKEALEILLQGFVAGAGILVIRNIINYFKHKGKPKGAEEIIFKLKKKYHEEYDLTEKTLYVDWVANKQCWVLYKKNETLNDVDFGKPTMLKTINHSEIDEFLWLIININIWEF